MLNSIDSTLKFIAEFLSIWGDGSSSNIYPPAHQTLAKPVRSFVVAPTYHSLLSLDIPKTLGVCCSCVSWQIFSKRNNDFSSLKKKSKTRKCFHFSVVFLHRFGGAQAVLGVEQNDLHLSAQCIEAFIQTFSQQSPSESLYKRFQLNSLISLTIFLSEMCCLLALPVNRNRVGVEHHFAVLADDSCCSVGLRNDK